MPQTNLFSHNKFGAKGAFYCRRLHAVREIKCCTSCNYHPSQLELSIARFLDETLPPGNWETHVGFLVKPATKRYPEIQWKADFHVFPNLKHPKIPRMIVEAKGVALKDFLRNLQYLEYFNSHALEQVIIVGTKAKKIDEFLYQVTTDQFKLKLKSLLLEAGMKLGEK